MWTLFEPVDRRGRGLFSEWRATLPKEAQATLDEKLRMLQIFGPVASCLKGVKGYGHLNKLRIQTPTLALRPLVCRGPLQMDEEFTLLLGAREVNFEWEPPGAPTQAETFRLEIISRVRRRMTYQVPKP